MSYARRSLQVVAFICTLVVGVTSMAVIVTQTTWFKEWLRGFIVRQADDYVNGRLSIGRLDGNLFFGVELADIDVTMNGKRVVNVKDLGLDYNAFTFIRGDVVLDHIRLNEPQLHLEQTAEGWNIARLIKARTPNQPKSNRTIEIGEIGVSNGTLYVDAQPVGTSGIDMPSRIDRLDASVGVKSDANALTVDVNHVSMRTAEPAFGLNALSGVIRRGKDDVAFENVSVRTEETSLHVSGSIRQLSTKVPVVDVKVTSDKFSVPEMAKLLPALRGYELQPAFELIARGPADRMAIDANAREEQLGKVIADLTVDAIEPGRRVAGTISMEHFNVGPVARSATLKSDITGQAKVDLALPSGKLPLSGSYAINAEQVQVAGYEARDVVAEGRIDGQTLRVKADAAAYGGRATTEGTVQMGQPLVLDLKGRAANLDLRNLPPALKAPGVPSNLQMTYAVAGRGDVFSGTVTLGESSLAGATIGAGTTAEFKVGGGAPSYAARGQVANLDVQQVGRGFGIRALATERYRSRINASFDVNGSGGGRYPLSLDATGTVTSSEMFGASFPTLDFTTNLAGGDARVRATGQFVNLDPAVVSGNTRVEGKLTGDLDVNTTVKGYASGVTIDSIDAAGRVSLQPSTVGGLAIESAVVDGTLANREGTLNQLSITGPDLTVTGQGPIALNETGASNLTLHVETPSLERIGTLVNQPLKGAAIIDATVTGNRRELLAQGTLKGSNLGHGENEALSLTSTFKVAVPELTAANARVEANSAATFLQVGGQEITELVADTTYEKSNLQFKALAKQGERQLETAGSMVLHTDHQEIHLPNLALRSGAIEWRTAPGAEATIRYGKDRVSIDNVQLVNGDQRITANGVVGSPSETLRVQVENVDVAQLEQLMLAADPRMAGRVTANATISGTTAAPQVAGDFALTQGAFRTFKFESFGGKVDYRERGVTMDVRLQQTPTAWLDAKGYAPMTLFRPNPPDLGPQHQVAGGADAIDIQVSSSQIDLGVIQGFTSYVSNVTGTVQANFKVTGSGYDPHLDGAVQISNGAFELPDLGTTYTGLDTRIELQPDGISISDMRIVDNHGSPLTVGGRLAVHEREVGGVDITVRSDDFKVIDNALGNVRLDTDLRLTGEIRKPRVEGKVDVSTGILDVARVLQQFTNDAYATEATELPVENTASAEARVRANAEIPAEQPSEKKLTSEAQAPPSQLTGGAAQSGGAANNAAAGQNGDTAPPAQASVFSALALDIAFGVPDDLVLRGQDIKAGNGGVSLGDMNVTVGGSVQVRKAPGDTIRLLGDVRTVRGNYTFQGRRFDIMRDGRIRFSGTDQIDPLLDIEARRIISGVEAFVRVRGTMREPELAFRSNPPLDEADVLSLIVFNQPINELGEGQQVSLAERAGALASGYVASGLARSIGSALNLNEFEIQAAGENGAGPSVMVGQHIGKNLYFRVRQGFGNSQATELILEYQIAEFLRLQGTAAETSGGSQRTQFRRVERGGLDLIFFFAY